MRDSLLFWLFFSFFFCSFKGEIPCCSGFYFLFFVILSEGFLVVLAFFFFFFCSFKGEIPCCSGFFFLFFCSLK